MSNLLTSDATQRVLLFWQGTMRVARAAILLLMFLIIFVGNDRQLIPTREYWVGASIIMIAIALVGLMRIAHIRQYRKYGIFRPAGGVVLMLAMMVASLVLTAFAIHGVFSVARSLSFEYQAFATIKSSLAARLHAGVSAMLSPEMTTVRELLDEVAAMHITLWRLACLIFAMAHGAITTLEIALIEQPPNPYRKLRFLEDRGYYTDNLYGE